MINIKGLTKSYGNAKVLKGIDIHVNKGEVVGIVGLNGAGKSTLMRSISGATDIDSGEVKIENWYTKYLNTRASRSKISFLNTTYNLYGELSVRENLEIYRRVYGASKEDMIRVIDELDINPFIEKEAGTLSTGMRKRAEIACSTMHKFKVLLMDEPTNGLDIEAKEDILRYIEGLAKEDNAILITSHNTKDIERLCDRIYVIREGQIIKEDSIKNIMANANENVNNWVINLKLESGLEEILTKQGYDYKIYNDVVEIIVSDEDKKNCMIEIADYEILSMRSDVADLEDAIKTMIS